MLSCIKSQEGKQRVIAYASRSLTRSERNYPVHKLEFLALKWAITDKFHEYLYGSQFQVYTDNNPLTYVLTTAKGMLRDIGGLLPYPTIHSASFKNLVRGIRMLMPYPALSGLRQWNWIHRQFMLSVKVSKPLMVKWKHFAMGLKQWMPYLRIRHHLA